MAADFEYWMVHLPDVAPETFLLFVHNRRGSTRLRDYSSGSCRLAGQPALEWVAKHAQFGVTRFEVQPHRTDDERYWHRQTVNFNKRYLTASSVGVRMTNHPTGTATDDRIVVGRAERGSRRQVQDYVNADPAAFSAAVLHAIRPGSGGRGLRVTWVSPLESEDFREYRDQEFLSRVGYADAASDLADFWPARGPSWDALGSLSGLEGHDQSAVLLLEAKSHPDELMGSGCRAEGASLEKITRSLAAAQRWCGVDPSATWTGRLYQMANRIAHLYFFLERLRRPAYLVNVYFSGDPIRPTDGAEWSRTIAAAGAELGLTRPVPNLIEVVLPAFPARSP